MTDRTRITIDDLALIVEALKHSRPGSDNHEARVRHQSALLRATELSQSMTTPAGQVLQ